MAKYTKAQKSEIADLFKAFSAYKSATNDEELKLFGERLREIQYQSGIELIFDESLCIDILGAKLRLGKA